MKRYRLIKKYPRLPSDWEEGMEIGYGDKSFYPCYFPCSEGYTGYSILPSEVKMSEFWEEVNDNNPLKLEVGKEYLLEYVYSEPCSHRVKITRFTRDGYPWMEGVDSDINGIVSPGYYKLIEEVIEKDYEILSYVQVISNRVYKKNKDGVFISDNMWSLSAPLESHSNIMIHSVKRLSDGEIFTVGDRIKEGYVTKIIVKKDKIYLEV